MLSYSSYTDAQLLTMLRESNMRAFEEIYRRYWHPLFLHAYHILDDENMAKDVIQEFFTDFWAKPADIQTNLKAYLYIAVRNRVLNQIRKHRTGHAFADLLARRMNHTSSYDTIAADLEYKDLMQLIDKEVEQLPQRMRQVFELSRKEFLTHRQIAEKLGTSEETVKKQISNSLRFLRTRMDRYLFLVLLLQLLRNHF